MPTQTGSIDLNSYKLVNDSASKTAKNYISADTNGIRIANANPATATTYQHQTANDTEFVVNGVSKAKISGDGARFGEADGTRLELTNNSLLFKDSNTTLNEGYSWTPYFMIQDFRDSTGYGIVTEQFLWPFSSSISLEGNPKNNTLIAFTASSDKDSIDFTYTVSGKRLQNISLISNSNSDPMHEGDAVYVVYKTNDPDAKALYFGNPRIIGDSDPPFLGMMSASLNGSTASGKRAFASGVGTTAFGDGSHSEGNDTEATGMYSHAEGNSSIAYESYSHAEGQHTLAIGKSSHAEGSYTVARKNNSHAGGNSTIAGGNDQTAIGSYNKEDDTSLLIIGNGSNESSRHNALTVNRSGDIQLNEETIIKPSITPITTVADIMSATYQNDSTAATIQGISYSQWGKVAQLYVAFYLNSSLTITASSYNFTDVKIGQLAVGKRPIQLVTFLDEGHRALFGKVDTDGVVKLTGGLPISVTIGTTTTIKIGFCYLLA